MKRRPRLSTRARRAALDRPIQFSPLALIRSNSASNRQRHLPTSLMTLQVCGTGSPGKGPPMREMKLKELKQKSPTELLVFAEENDVENASIDAEAGADVRDPQAARQRRGADYRRGRGRDFAGSDSPSCDRRTPTIFRAPTIFMCLHRKSGAWDCEPATRSRVSSEAPRRGNGISRCSNATPSISRTRRKLATRSISTI